MARPVSLVVMGWVLALGLACTGGVEPIGPETPLTLEERVGAVAHAADVDAASRDAALAEHGLTMAAYEAALFDIAMDANRTRAYEKARSAP